MIRPLRLVPLAVAAALSAGGPLAAQDPDSVVVADTLGVAADTLELAADTLEAAPDSILPDSVSLADTVGVYRTMPALQGDVPPAEYRGGQVWHWDRADLQGRPRFTLLELLAGIPGGIPLRGGDYGLPEGFVLDGMTGGRLRVFFDGVEEVGLAGSAPDLSRIALVGLESVTVRRIGGELRIELEPLQAKEDRPLSMIEAGTGDLDTNLFRGTFIQGDALGGALGIGIERIDTQGPRREEPGSRQGVWLRYMRPIGDRLTVAGEFRRQVSEQTLGIGPDRLQRHLTVLRGRYELTPSITVEGYWSKNSLRETEDSISPVDVARGQVGARIGWATSRAWARGEIRNYEGGRPLWRTDVDVGGHLPGIGTGTARVARESYAGESGTLWGASAETAPVFGLSLFGAIESGERGWRGLVDTTTVALDSLGAPLPVADPYVVPTGMGSRDARRIGARFEGLGLDVSGTLLRTETDSIRPIATFLDGGGMAFAGDVAEGWEARVRYDLPELPWMNGFFLDGSMQRWDTPGIYRPEEIYRGGIGFHRTYLDSGNFELWAGLMVEGRSEMMLPFADPEVEVEEGSPTVPLTTPFYQSWNGWLQFRVITVRIFIRFENVFVRPANQDFPGRLLPATRAMYGVRWTLFN